MTCPLRNSNVLLSMIYLRYFSSSITTCRLFFIFYFFGFSCVLTSCLAGHVQVYGNVQIGHRLGQGVNPARHSGPCVGEGGESSS